MRLYVTMWVVRAGEDLYVSWPAARTNPWYRRAKPSRAAYHAEDDRYGPRIVGSVVGAHAEAVAVRLVPRPAED